MTEQDRVFTKCAWRLVPLMLLLYFVSYLDRVNIAFAALTMNKDLGFSPAVYGLGAGIFFIGYFLFQIPANLMLERFGPRRWIFFILILWGALSAGNALIRDPLTLYALRFLLGCAEAGLYPGIVYYLTLWFPASYRARVTANFHVGLPLAFVIGSPLSSYLLELNGLGGLHGWQWMFVLEGLPAIVLAFVVLKVFADSPAQASWLSEAERATIARHLATGDAPQHKVLWRALLDPRVIVLGLIFFADQCAASGSRFWLPQMLQGMGFSNIEVGYAVALPFVIGIGAMSWWGHSGDKRDERVWHIALPLLISALGLLVASVSQSPILILAALVVLMIGPLLFLAALWGFSSVFLAGRGSAGSIAMVSSLGSLGGFVGPNVIGTLKTATGAYGPGMSVIALMLIASVAAVLIMGRASMVREKVKLA